MTGWGQEGPYSGMAGHDINYIALSGTLSMIGRAGQAPVPPLNLIGDFGGGGMLLAFGVVCGLLEASRSGQGQVIDAAMVDGAALLAAMIHGFRASGTWGERGTNLLDTGLLVLRGVRDGRRRLHLVRFAGAAVLPGDAPNHRPRCDDADGRGPVPDPTDRSPGRP